MALVVFIRGLPVHVVILAGAVLQIARSGVPVEEKARNRELEEEEIVRPFLFYFSLIGSRPSGNRRDRRAAL